MLSQDYRNLLRKESKVYSMIQKSFKKQRKYLKENIKDLLIAIKEGPHNNAGRTTWVCKCDCGNEKIVLTTQLTGGKTLSCGCLQKERTRQANQSKNLTG